MTIRKHYDKGVTLDKCKKCGHSAYYEHNTMCGQWRVHCNICESKSDWNRSVGLTMVQWNKSQRTK